MTIEFREDAQILWVFKEGGWGDDSWTKRCPAVESFPERPLTSTSMKLPFAVRNVIADAIAQDIVQGFRRRNVFRSAADCDYEFALVV